MQAALLQCAFCPSLFTPKNHLQVTCLSEVCRKRRCAEKEARRRARVAEPKPIKKCRHCKRYYYRQQSNQKNCLRPECKWADAIERRLLVRLHRTDDEVRINREYRREQMQRWRSENAEKCRKASRDRAKWRYHNDPEYRRKVNERNEAQRKNPEFREAAKLKSWLWRQSPENAERLEQHRKNKRLNPVMAAISLVEAVGQFLKENVDELTHPCG